MKHLLCLLILFLFLPIQAEEVPDSLLTESYIQRIHLRNPQRALQLLNLAEQCQLPNLPPFRIDMLRVMCHEAAGEYLLKEDCAHRALAYDSVKLVPDRKLQMLHSLATALKMQGKYEESVRLCKETIDLARQLNNLMIEGKTHIIVGCIYSGMNLPDKALEAFQTGISILKKSDNVRIMAQLSTGYGDFMNALITANRLAEAIKLGKEREVLIQRMAAMPGPPQGYIDQQLGFLYSKLAFLLQNTGEKEKAEKYFQRFLKTHFASRPDGKSEIIPYLLEAHRYREALKLNDSAFLAQATHPERDTINYNHAILLNRYAQAYRGLSLYRQADVYQQRFSVLLDSIYTRQQKSKALEYSSLFQLHEKELQLSRIRAQSQQRKILFASSCIIITLLSILLGIICYHWHKTRLRNRIAVKQVNELLAQREELHKAFKQLETQETLRNEISFAQPDEKEKEDTSLAPKENTDPQYIKFMRMERYLIENKLFLQPGFGRDDLLRIGNISKNELPRLLQKYTNTDTVSDYLNRLRVEYSVKLMKEKPMLSINAIAEEAGFKSYTTFYRAFYKVVGLSPAQYLKV